MFLQQPKMRRALNPRKNMKEVKGISKAIIENDDSSDDGGNSPAPSSTGSKKPPKVNTMVSYDDGCFLTFYILFLVMEKGILIYCAFLFIVIFILFIFLAVT